MKRLISAILVLVMIISIPMQASAWWWDTDAKKYEKAIAKLNEGNWAEAIELFEKIPMYEDSAKYTTYAKAMQLADAGNYDLAIASMTALGDFKDSALLVVYLQGQKAESLEEYDEAEALYMTIPSFRDVMDRLAAIPGKKDAKLTLKRTTLIADIRASENPYASQELQYRIEQLFKETYTTSDTQLLEELYADAEGFLAEGLYNKSCFIFQALDYDANYSDSGEMAFYVLGRYHEANEDYNKAWQSYSLSGGVRDSNERYTAIVDKMNAILIENRTAFIAALRASEGITSEIKTKMTSLFEDTYFYNENVHYEGLYAEAEALLEEGLYSKALFLFQTLGEKNYNDSNQMVTYTRGRWEEAVGKYDLAIGYFSNLGNFSDAIERIVGIGDIHLSNQQFDLAEAAYMKVLNTDIGQQRIYALAQQFETTGNYEKSIALFGTIGNYQDAADREKNCIYLFAETLLASQEWDAAKAIFSKIHGYKNADTMILECDYQKAYALYAAKDWTGALSIYRTISGYKDVDTLLETDHNLLTVAAVAALDAAFQPGKYVSFGHYPQSVAGNDNTPIEWLVLERDGKKALLLSRYGLDAKPYNTDWVNITWEQCTLRKWLNNDFLNNTFSSQEQGAILLTNVDNSKSQGYSSWSSNECNNTQDKVFLLSYAEVNKYLGVKYGDSKNTKSRVEPTAYAINQGAYSSSKNNTADGKEAGWWWLRSPGYDRNYAAVVYSDGSLLSISVSSDLGSFRPALWVNLDAMIPLQ